MFSFCDAERGPGTNTRGFLISIEEEIAQALGIPYRLMNVCYRRTRRKRCEEDRPRGVVSRARAGTAS